MTTLKFSQPLLALALVTTMTCAMAAPTFTPYGDTSGMYSPINVSPAPTSIYFPSGATAGESTGDMKSQALATIEKLRANMIEAGLSLEDVAFARAYLAPGTDGTIDYAGWNAAWNEIFNNPAKPVAVKPSRTTVGVPLLGRRGTLIEIDFIAFPAAKPELFPSKVATALPSLNAQLQPYGTKENRILGGIGVKSGAGLYWTQGSTAPVLDASLPTTDVKHRGDMKTQSRNTLLALQKNLAGVGLTFKDVLYLRAFLGPDVHKGGAFDYDGWNAAYGEFFNTAENPHKPARTTVTTPSYGNPSTLIEIEIIAAFPTPPTMFDAKAANPRLKTYGEQAAMISSGVAVAPGSSLLVAAGVVSSVPGDMKTQALSALAELQKRMALAGMSFKDVAFLRAYVVPEKDGSIDREGWTQAYTQYFNNPQQPHKPARTTIGVQSLPRPDLKIEIDVIAIAPKAKG